MAITEKYSSASGSGAADGSSPSNEWSWSSMLTAINGLGAGGAAGLRVNHRGATSGGTSAQSFTVGGSSTSPFILRGYGSAPGDGYQGRTNGNGPLVTTNIPTVTYTSSGRVSFTANFFQVESMKFVAAVGLAAVTLSAFGVFTRGIVENSSTSSAANGIAVSSVFAVPDDFDVALTGASGGGSALVLQTTGARATLGRISGGPNIGVSLSSGSGGNLTDSLVYGSASHGVAVTATGAALMLSGCTVVDNGGDGVNVVTSNTALQVLLSNLITDNGGYGLNAVSAANAVFSDRNRYDRNTSGAKNLATDWLAGSGFGDDVTSVLQAAEYSNAAGRDYRLLSTSPAKGIGGWSYRDIGAIQRQESGGGSSGYSRSRIVNAGAV